jgi:RNA polymerase sigma-70 factor (ECF subfamily)
MSYRQFQHCADSDESISCILSLPTDNREVHHRDVSRSNTTTDIVTTPLIVTGSASVSSSDSCRIMKTQTPGLATLIERVGNGDEEAFSAVYDQLAPVIFGTVKRVLRDHAMSEEVAQEVLVEMWSAVHKFDPDRASVTSWAVTIARRRAVDRVRKEQSQRTRIESLSQQRHDNGADPSDEVAETADAQHVRRAIERLPVKQRDVIRLAFLDGQTHGAIAEQLGLPLGTVKGRVRGGLNRLHRDMRYRGSSDFSVGLG